MIKTSQTLAPNEQFRLEQCEKAIERGLNTFVEVGRALTEIRDAKLYRVGFKTFEAYCKERWEIGRSRAYELIDQAKVVAAITDAGVDLSAMADIPKRDVRAVKDELPTISAEVKARVDQGEEPAVAAASVIKETAEKAKAEKVAKQAENDAARAAAADALPQAIKDQQKFKADAIAAKKAQPVDVEALQAEVEQSRETIASLEAENASLKAELKRFDEMRVQFDQGGFEEVIAGKDEEIRALLSRVERESQEKVANLRSADWWKKKAIELGYSSREVIDLDA